MHAGNIRQAPPPASMSADDIKKIVDAERSATDSKRPAEPTPTTTPMLTDNRKPWPDLSRLRDVIRNIDDEAWPGLAPPPDLKTGYSIYNPSICLHPTKPDRFLVVLRSANYAVTEDHRYVVQTAEAGVMTDNYLAEIDVVRKDGKTVFHHLGRLKTPPMPFPNKHIGGFEDVRLQYEPVSGRLFASFTSLEMEQRGMPAITLTELDIGSAAVKTTPVLLRGPQPARPKEKNWMSFVLDGGLFFVYSINPLVVLQADPATGNTKTVQKDAAVAGIPADFWRGSSPLCPMPAKLAGMLASSASSSSSSSSSSKSQPNRAERRLLAAISKKTDDDRYFVALGHTGEWPKYATMFLVFRATKTGDDGWRLKLTHYSSRFIFERHDIEYSLGLAITPVASEFVLPYSLSDRICRCARFDPADVLPRLHAVA
jgi:hypothetical protein